MPTLSVVIPTRRLDQTISDRIDRLNRVLPAAQRIVVEPDDLGIPIDATASGKGLICAPRGRGSQCSAGARATSGQLLMFLHDDTELPDGAAAAIAEAFADPRVVMTCFRLRFDQRHWLLDTYSWFSRFEGFWTTFGDQAMVVRRDAFEAVGGMPDWPLFEDVELARRMRSRGRVVKLKLSVTTSAARYRANGFFLQQLGNALRMLRFLLGTPPQRLAAGYEAQAGSEGGR